MNVKILADSASDLSQKWYEKLNVEVVPVHVFIEGKEYLDGVTISPTEMYAEMRNGKRVTTSQPNPQAFKKPIMQSAQKNEPLIYFAISGFISCTYDSAIFLLCMMKVEY